MPTHKASPTGFGDIVDDIKHIQEMFCCRNCIAVLNMQGQSQCLAGGLNFSWCCPDSWETMKKIHAGTGDRQVPPMTFPNDSVFFWPNNECTPLRRAILMTPECFKMCDSPPTTEGEQQLRGGQRQRPFSVMLITIRSPKTHPPCSPIKLSLVWIAAVNSAQSGDKAT